MRFKPVGNKREEVINVVHNAEASITIAQGSPVFLAANGTLDGLDVKASESVDSSYSGLFFGLALSAIAAGDYGEAKVYGFMENVRVILRSRAATTDSWASRSAIAVGDQMIPFINVAGVQGIQRQTAGATAVVQPNINAGFTKASAASRASGGTTSDASTTANGLAEYVTVGKVFLRCM